MASESSCPPWLNERLRMQYGLFRRFAPLRKCFAFVAANDAQAPVRITVTVQDCHRD